MMVQLAEELVDDFLPLGLSPSFSLASLSGVILKSTEWGLVSGSRSAAVEEERSTGSTPPR